MGEKRVTHHVHPSTALRAWRPRRLGPGGLL